MFRLAMIGAVVLCVGGYIDDNMIAARRRSSAHSSGGQLEKSIIRTQANWRASYDSCRTKE